MSATSVGQIGLDLVVNQNQFSKQMTGIQSLAKKTGKTLVAAFAVKNLARFGKECIRLGSDLGEVQNVVDVTFPAMSKRVDEFAQNAAAKFGLSETMAKKYTGTFGAMSKAFGFSEKEAYKMSTALTGLAGDVASFYNLSQDEAYTKLKSVFTGETESLKDLGVVMTQAALDQYALANGFGKTTKAMSESEKVALRYSFVQSKLSAASGDFIRTSNSWSNQVKILKLQLESLMGTIGQGLINLFTPIIKVINLVISKIMSLANAFKAFTELLTGKKSSSTASSSTEGLDNATESAENLAGATTAAGNAAEKTAKKMRELMGFDQVNKLSDMSSSSGSSGGSGGAAGDSFDMGTLSDDASKASELGEKYAKMFEPILELFERFKTEVNWDLIKEKLDNLWKALEPLAENVGAGLFWFFEEVLVPLGIWIMNEVVTRFVENFTNLISILNSVIEISKPVLNWLWENFLKPLASFVGDTILAFCDRFIEKTTWIAEIAKELEGIGEFGVKATFEAIVEKSFDKAREKFDKLKNSKAVKTITGKITEKWNSVKKKWDKIKSTTAVKTLSAKISDKFSKFKKMWDSLKDKTLSIKANVSAAITNIKQLINDKIIAKLNGAINILNKLPGVNVPKIPKLAQGGFVKRNTPQLAVIGDNMRYGEIVAPENKLEAMARQAASLAGGGNNLEIIALLRQILLLLQTMDLSATIEGNSVKQLVVRLINDHTRATGMCEINI